MSVSRPPARRSTAVLLALALAGGGTVALSSQAGAAPVGGTLFYGLTATNGLVSFRTNGAVTTPTAVTGLDAGDVLVGLDVRPATGQLYALAKGATAGDDNLYVIDPATAAATKAGAALTTRLAGTASGFDANPVADRFRVVSDAEQNLRVNPETGVVVVDEPLDPPLLIADAAVTGAAYSNNRAGATTTTLFDLDAVNNRLYVQSPPDSGDLRNTAPLAGASTVATTGFDIDGADGTGYALIDTGTGPGLYTIRLDENLETVLTPTAAQRIGTFTLSGLVDLTVATPRIGAQDSTVVVSEASPTVDVVLTRTGDLSDTSTVNYALTPGTATAGTDYTALGGTAVFAAGAATATITVPITPDTDVEDTETFTLTLSSPSANSALTTATTTAVSITNDDRGAVLYGLTADERLARIEAGSGIQGTPVALTGLAATESVAGIDVRPADGKLYAVIDGATDRLATVDPDSGAVTAAAPLSTALSGTSFAVDVNPVTDRIRVISDTDQNLSVDPTTGAVTAQTAITPATADVRGAAYTRNLNGATATTLFDIDVFSDSLLVQDPPADGATVLRAPLGVDAVGEVGFDIDGTNERGYASLTVGVTTGLYAIALPTAPTTAGAATRLGSYALPGVVDVAVATPRFSIASTTVTEGTLATVTVTRTGDVAEAGSVKYTTSDGTAVNGVDYIGAAGTLTFAAGERTKSFTFPVAADGVTEPTENLNLLLTEPSPGSLIATSSGTVTITDAASSVISVLPGPQPAAETAGSVDVLVSRTNPERPASVSFTTVNGGARSGEDFVAASGVVEFAAGEASKAVRITLLDDTKAEPNESFALVLSSPSPGSSLGNARAVITTTSDDPKAATAITVRATAKVRYPSRAIVSGVLTGANGAGLGGRTVAIVYTPRDNSAPPRVVARVTTQANGLFSTSLLPSQNAALAAVYGGSAAEDAAASDTVVTQVAYAIPTVTGPTTARPGQVVTYRGTIQPGPVRAPVVLQLIRPNGSIANITSVGRASSAGAYVVTRPFRAGTYRLRVLAVGTAKNIASASRTITLRVR